MAKRKSSALLSVVSNPDTKRARRHDTAAQPEAAEPTAAHVATDGPGQLPVVRRLRPRYRFVASADASPPLLFQLRPDWKQQPDL